MTSASVRLTGTSCHKQSFVTIDDEERHHIVKANHINPLGRLKPLPSPYAEERNYTHTSQFDLTRDLSRSNAQGSGFNIKAWCQEADCDYSYECALFDDIFSDLMDSPMARSLINFAAEQEWSIYVEPLNDAAYDLDDEHKVLLLNNYNLKLPTFEKSGFFRHALILSLVKGLRDIWHIECRQPYEHGLTIESVLLLERVRAADCDVIALLTAWELRGEGMPEIWRHLLGAPEGDMALRFTEALEREPQKHFNNSALIEAFHGWFDNAERVGACDHQTLDMIDCMVEESRETGLYGHKKAKPQFIESLSRLPDRTFYLQDYGFGISKDPHFAGLEDDVNQAYYLQIKHEMETTHAGGIYFRDSKLAAKIFPDD